MNSFIAKQQRVTTQNDYIVGNLSVASNVVKKLVNARFTVLNVNLNRSLPVVEIEPTKKTANLEGVTLRRGNDKNGNYRTLASVKFHGCLVEWTER